MPLMIERGNIIDAEVDVIVNTSNPGLRSGGGVNGAIHRAAGPLLDEVCKTIGGCAPGGAKITPGFNLKCKFIIHTVGPKWSGGHADEYEKLASCYRNALKLAIDNKCHSVAFPLISSGAYGFPKEKALKVAITEISTVLALHDLDVKLIIFDKNSFAVSESLVADIVRYIDTCYIQTKHLPSGTQIVSTLHRENSYSPTSESFTEHRHITVPGQPTQKPSTFGFKKLSEAVQHLDESFVDMLLRKIDEQEITDSLCYQRANITKQTFWKVKNQKHRPSKNNVLAFAIALRLPLDETKEMIMKAGYALSHSSKFDVIIEYCIIKRIYDIHEVNIILFDFEQPLLGM